MKKYKKNGEYTKTFIDFMSNNYMRYLKSHNSELHDVYVKPSQQKIYAMERIKSRATESKPYIISHNICHFTVAYFDVYGEDEYFCVDTGRNLYEILAILL